MAAFNSDQVFEIVDKIISDRKNSNLILQLEDVLSSENANLFKVIAAAVKLFTHFLRTREMSILPHEENLETPQVKYKKWLQERYSEFINHMLDYVIHPDQEVQKCALDGVMEFVRVEGLHPLAKSAPGMWCFPKETFEAVVKHLINEDHDMSQVIVHFKTYLKDDVKLYTLKALYDILHKDNIQSEMFLLNTYALLTKIRFLNDSSEDVTSSNTFISGDGAPKFELKRKAFSKAFTQTWMLFLKCKIPNSLYKRLLTYLPKKVLPHLSDPLLLTDFLTLSYNSGGIISLLALNGIFYLMQKYNLEYPDFYKKLYSLFTVEVVASPYRSTFFFLADLFLSSTHLPAYLVAAFTKRLSRLLLFVPPHVEVVILAFIKNLLIRHPSLEILIHNPGQGLIKDPYNFENLDPATCDALKSSLWEIKSLQNHWHPSVSKKAECFNSPLPRTEQSFSDIIDLTCEDMMRKEASGDLSEVQLSCTKPCGLFQRAEDHMCDLWTL